MDDRTLQFQHNPLNLQDMSFFADFLSAVSDQGAHEHLPWLVLPLKTMFELLAVGEKERMKWAEVMRNEEAHCQIKVLFEIEANALYYVQAKAIYHSDLPVNGLKHTSIAERGIHSWLEVLKAGEMLDRVNLLAVQKDESAQLGSTNMVSYVPSDLIDQIVYGNNFSGNSRRWEPLFEHHSVALIKKIVQEFSKPGSFLPDAIDSILSALIASP